MTAKTGLLFALGAFTAFYIVIFVRRALQPQPHERVTPRPSLLLVSFVMNFFDTLGIGSFATTTAAFRRWGLVQDEHIPGTLNVGYTLPTIAQAFIFTTLVPVESRTLILMIAAAVVGSWLGAGVVVGLGRRQIQLGMGAALLVAAFLMLMAFAGNVGPEFGSTITNPLLRQGAALLRAIAAPLQPIAEYMPKGGTLLMLSGISLLIGIAGNFILGALMTLGIGLYGPCMILIYMLGMDPTAAFPIMMGSCAFLMPIASARFIRSGNFDLGACVALTLGGVPAVLLAAFLVKSMDLNAVRILVVVVVFYTAIGLLRSARRPAQGSSSSTAARGTGSAAA